MWNAKYAKGPAVGIGNPTESIQCSNWQSTTAIHTDFYDEKVKNEGKPVLGTLVLLYLEYALDGSMRCEIRLVSDSRVLA